MAQDYDTARPDVAEQTEDDLKRVRQTGAADARSVVQELDEVDAFDDLELPGAIVNDELVVKVVPQGADEFTCASCFMVRHRSQAVREQGGLKYCRDCEG